MAMTGSRRELQRSNYAVTTIVPTTGVNSCKGTNRAVNAVGSDEKTSGDSMIRGESHMRVGGKINGCRQFCWKRWRRAETYVRYGCFVEERYGR